MPFDRSRYPVDWPAISLAVRAAAGWRCEFCGIAQAERLPSGGICVLTVAHLNHTPGTERRPDGSIDRDVLRALCQPCHLRYDARLHATHAAETRRRRRMERGQAVLALGEVQ